MRRATFGLPAVMMFFATLVFWLGRLAGFAMIVLTVIPVFLAQRLMRDTGVVRRGAANVTEAVESAQITAV